MTAIDERRRTSFDARALDYDAVRPSYPAAAFDDLVALGGIDADSIILEVGAGTGKATVPLARRGHRIIAIEPGAQMAAVLRANVAGCRVAIEQTTFEAYRADGPADMVLSAQAFHWVTPALRYVKAAQVLRPGGALALLRNDKAPLERPLRDELDRAYARHVPSLFGSQFARDENERITVAIGESGRFGPVELVTYPWTEVYSSADYVRLLGTYSDHAVLEPRQSEPLYGAITAAIDRRGGSIAIPYVAALHLARPR